MHHSDGDSGLELRLPWGKPENQPAPSAARAPVPSGFPTGPSDEPGAWPPEPPAVQALRELLQDRADRLDNRLSLIGAALPELVGQLRTDLTAQQAATTEALAGRSNEGQLEELEGKIDLVARDLTRRLEALETLVLSGHSATMMAISEVLGTLRPVPAPSRDGG